MGALSPLACCSCRDRCNCADRADRCDSRGRRRRSRRGRRGRRVLARGRIRRAVRHRRQLRRRPRRRPHHPLLPQERLVRDPVAPQHPGARRRGSRRGASRPRQERPLHTAGPALPAHCAVAGAGRLGDHTGEPHDRVHPRPFLALLLVDLVGSVGLPGRLRRALLRLLREAHGPGRRGSRRLPGAGPDRRLCQHLRQDPPALLRPRGRRRRHSRRLSERGDRPRPQRRAVRRRVEPRRPEAAREPRQLQPSSRDAERQRSDLGRLRGTDAAHGRPRDRRADHLHAERRRHRRARAQHLPLHPRAARVHPSRVCTGRVRAPA